MSFFDFRERYVYWGLLLSLVLSFTFIPFLEHAESLNFFLLLFMFFAIIAVSDNKVHFFGGGVLSIPMALAVALSDSLLTQLSFCSAAVFFLYTVILSLQQIFRTLTVDTTMLVAAICVYLFFAVTWMMLYGVIGIHFPDSFNIPYETDINDLMYFSLVTLTTLGYGDIFPLSSPAKSTAVMEVLVRQTYLTVLVARLVGLHIAKWTACTVSKHTSTKGLGYLVMHGDYELVEPYVYTKGAYL